MSQDKLQIKDGSNEVGVAAKSKRELQDKLEEYVAIVATLKIHLEDAARELKEKDAKIAHLESMLSKMVPIINQESELDELTIAKIQLKRLGQIGLHREFSNEEARRFEIFSKVIQMSEKNSKPAPPQSSLKDVNPAKLIEIATSKIKDVDE